MSVPDGLTHTRIDATCQPGETAVGGGANSSDDGAIVQSIPLHDGAPATDGQIPNGWGATAQHGPDGVTTVYVVCAS